MEQDLDRLSSGDCPKLEKDAIPSLLHKNNQERNAKAYVYTLTNKIKSLNLVCVYTTLKYSYYKNKFTEPLHVF